MTSEISETGFWRIDNAKFEHEHVYDSKLSYAILVLAKSLSVKKAYDFGCGHGKYTSAFLEDNIDCIGFDGNPVTQKFTNCKVQDLTDLSWSIEPVDFLLCLEVCEHVPKEYEQNLIKNIDKHVSENGTLIISWAIPGQMGLGHVNCQPNDYCIKLFNSMGYTYLENDSKYLRKFASLGWFKNTIMVFKKQLKQ